MIKKFVAAICLLSSLVMTGCTMANLPRVEKYPDLTKAEDFIIKGESDVKAVREIFGAPTIYGRTQNEDHLVYGYAIIGEKEYGVSFAESILESFKTLGLGKHPPRGSVYTKKIYILNLTTTIKLKIFNIEAMLGCIQKQPLESI